jgi:pseudouridine kinase
LRTLVVGGCLQDVSTRPDAAVRPATSNAARIELAAGGGARNAAESLRRLGFAVTFVSCVGRDAAGEALAAELAASGLDSRLVRRGRTGVYVAALHPDGSLDRGYCDPGAIESLDAEELLGAAGPLDGYAAALADANLSAAALAGLTASLAAAGVPWALDPVSEEKARRLGAALAGCAILKPNQSEAAVLTGIDCSSREGSARAARGLREQGVRRVVLSRAADGFHLLWDDFDAHVPAAPTELVDASGGGDALLAAAVAALLRALPGAAVARALARCAALACATRLPVSPALTPALLEP